MTSRPDKSAEPMGIDLTRLARVSARAAETFGSESTAFHWLRTANRALVDKRQPIELLGTAEGEVLVLDIIGRIDHGIIG